MFVSPFANYALISKLTSTIVRYNPADRNKPNKRKAGGRGHPALKRQDTETDDQMLVDSLTAGLAESQPLVRVNYWSMCIKRCCTWPRRYKLESKSMIQIEKELDI